MMDTYRFADVDGDRLAVTPSGGGVYLRVSDVDDDESVAVLMRHDEAAALRDWLTDCLFDCHRLHEAVTGDGQGNERCIHGEKVARADPLPDGEADGYAWPEGAGDSIAAEAHRLVHGDRNDGYGHPTRNFTRIAHMWTALLSDKLGEGEFVDVQDVARCMVAMKLSRDVHSPKRDNRVDAIGYVVAMDRMETGR